jgi:D-xylose transport system substrate-binding protein
MKRKAAQTATASVSAVAALVLMAGCSSSSSPSASSSGGAKASEPLIGIILPDAVTSPRWENADQPGLAAECTKDHLNCDIQNAEDSDTNEVNIGNTMINVEHVQVLVVAGVDPAPTVTITNEAEKAGIQVIDYDRAYGAPDYYLSFNNQTVGVDQGNALVAAIKAKGITKPDVAVLNGATTDGNAVLFNKGYMSVIQPYFTAGTWKQSANQWVTGWSNPLALTDFQAMYTADPNINVIMVANDGMADAIIPFLQQKGLAGKVVVSGQDASALGLQDVLQGSQSFTIYKPSSAEAVPTIDLAADLVKGQKPTSIDGVNLVTQSYSTTTKAVPSVLAQPTTITLSNVDAPVASGYTPYATVCSTAALVALCTSNGITAPAGS